MRRLTDFTEGPWLRLRCIAGGICCAPGPFCWFGFRGILRANMTPLKLDGFLRPATFCTPVSL